MKRNHRQTVAIGDRKGDKATESDASVDKRGREHLQTGVVLCPDALVYAVAEVGRFFGQDGLAALRALVFGKPAVGVFDDSRVLHGDERVAAAGGVEPHLGEAWVGLGKDVQLRRGDMQPRRADFDLLE